MLVVLLPTDFSENARNAAYFASQLFKYRQAHFYLVHAAEARLPVAAGSPEEDELPGQEAEHLKALEDTLQNTCSSLSEKLYNPRHTFDKRLLQASLKEGLNPLVRELEADIVVMGTQGCKARAERSFGSRTLRALKGLDCPVLAIPYNYAYEPPRRVVFATDFRVPYKRRELKLLCEVSGSYRSLIELLYVSDSDALDPGQQDNKRFLEEALHKAHIAFSTVSGTERAETILDYLGRRGAQLLVMVNTGHGLVDRFLEQFTLDYVGLHVNIPLLVMQNRERPVG